MDIPILRATKTALLIAVFGGSAMVGVSVYQGNSNVATIAVADASGRVLAADATPQPLVTNVPAQATATGSPAPTAAAGSTWTDDLEATKVGGMQSVDGNGVAPQPSATPSATAAPVKPKGAAPKASKPKTAGTTAPAPAGYVGANHVWIPALGISRAVQPFSCSRVTPPANYMYRWGCAGTNNVYLLGHAYGPMKPLHDAFTHGTLKVGMLAYYADAAGHTHIYRVIWWKTTPPVTEASWAWASLSVPSMTLQTCVGANSELRLMVRLEEVAG